MTESSSTPHREDPPHRHELRVYYEDTDFSGVAYHAGVLRFLERGRTELLRALGHDQRALFEGGRPLAFAVRRITVDFLRPGRMDDLLTVETRPAVVSGASLDLDQRLMRGEEVLVTARVKVACVEAGRARRIPDDLRARFEAGPPAGP